MTAYYNEINPAAVAVLRELISRGVIAPGDVDDRSIKDVQPNDLRKYTQCHFFAGGGLWSVAARIAGWPDERRLWTGSCPCQPFSAAGKRGGTDDPRHLWPDFHRLISAERPPVIMGEQTAGADGYGWFDGVRADLASENYSGRAVDIPVCAIDGPHQRNRLYWIAVEHAQGERWREGRAEHELRSGRNASTGPDVQLQSDTDGRGRDGRTEGAERIAEQRALIERPIDGLQPQSDRRHEPRRGVQGPGEGSRADGERAHDQPRRRDGRNGSWWADAEWLVSPIDDKARRSKPGISFLVDGLSGRVDLWGIGGNAISPVLGAEVISAFLEAEEEALAAHSRPASHFLAEAILHQEHMCSDMKRTVE